MRLPAELKLASNGDGARTAKVTIVARSGDPVNHPYWGAIVHDFEGMSHKARIPLDYNHDPEDSIGYLNKFDTSSGDLVCSGAIVLIQSEADEDVDDDTVALVAKMQAGVPYEASIEFSDDMSLEFVPEGMSANVNGNDLPGPLTIVRQWTLIGVAICKFGVDADTSAELQLSKSNVAAKRFFCRISTKGETMSKTTATEKIATVETPATPEVNGATQLSQQAEEAPKAAEIAKPSEVKAPEATVMSPTPAVEPVKSDSRTEAKKFIDAFGDAGIRYFAEGKTYDEAVAAHLKLQHQQITDLTQRLSITDRGAATPVKFQDGEATTDPKVVKLSRNLGDNLAKLAASIKLPK